MTRETVATAGSGFAVVPFIIEGVTGITAILIGGTALLIAVNVLLDLIRKVDAQVSLHEY